ncbi:pyocin knob domain-containing protein [Chryseobacterium indoltheticum]|uniref:pyocin knob domain-containing protein n=1 Tax=Chryseobacterium indoltheticum TaxID=254 RepID=UPI001913ABDF|nr:pyocin knob domain-containing protein [Chryseobacterium indoltheticum]QQQ28300.1 hypothetical protein JJL46_19880 [Chryseobacterium indoltheticum]
MDVKYSYYNTSKGYRVTGGTAAHFLKADGSLDNTSYIPANTEINMGDKNLNFTSGSLSKFENSSRVFNKVYQRSSNANQVGILSFKFPQASTSATMFDVTLKIYGWQNRILGNIRIGFYKITGVAVNGSHKAIIECSDNFPTNIINVGIDAAGMVCINIGEATTVWNTYLNVEVERVVSFHSGANFDWSKGWLQTIETDVSSYISIANVATEVVASRSWTDANNIGSIPKAPIALGDNSLNTITTPGFYNQTADANATIARNYPIANAGSLNVYRTTINGVIQEYTTYNNNITYKRNYNGSSWGVWKTMLNSVDLGSSAITSNTNQTGLTGDKTTSGNWIFNGTGANSLTVLRPGSTINNSIALGFDTPSMYMGLADADTFAVGTNANLVLSNRTFWVDNLGNASLKGNLNFNSELILQRNNVTRFRTSGTDTVISSEGTNIYLRPKGDSSNVNQIIFNNNTSQYTDNHNILLGTQTSVGSSVFHTGVAGALSGYGAWMGHNLQWDGTNFIQPRGNLHSWGFTANNHKGFSFNFGLSTGTNGGIVSLTEVLKIDNSGLITTLNYGNSLQWNTAFNWGNHANAGYATTAQLGLYIPLSQRGAANGVATLDAAGLIPTTQLPSYVDDVIEGASLAVINALPANEKQTGKIYVTTDTNKSYRWSGSVFVEISSGAVQSVNGQTGVVNLIYSDVGASAVNHTHTIAQVTGLQSALDGKVDDSQVLTNVPAGALFTDTIYTLPTATSTNKGGVEIFSDTVQTVASNAVTATASRTYGIQLNSAGQAVVNVPWVDTNTSYTAGNGLTLTGTAFSLPITVSGSGNYIADVAQNANGITVTKGNLPSYSLTVATSTSLGGIRLFSDVANNMAPNSVTEIKGRSYAVQLNNNNQAVVNVPWTDSNTIYTSSNGIALSGTNFTPTYGTTVNTVAQGNDSRINNGETAFGWGNHNLMGYSTQAWVDENFVKTNNGISIDITGQNLNTYKKTGFYKGLNLTGAPNDNNGWWYVVIETHDSTWVTQKATSFGSGNTPNVTYQRTMTGGVWSAWTQIWTTQDFTVTNIQQWNYASQYGLKLNEEFSINTGSRLMLADGFYGNESGMMDHTFERFVSGKQNEYYKYGSLYGNFDGLNFNVDTKLFGMGREANKDDKLTVEGSVKASKNFKSEDENPDTLFIPNGNLATLRDEIVNDQSDYAIRLDPHEYNIDPSGVLAVDDRNRLIHIIGEQVKMTVDFKRVYPKQQIVIYNFDQSGGTMAVKIQGKLIATLSARCFLRLYVTKSQRVIAERQQPCDFVW